MADPFYRSAELRWFLPGHAQENQLRDWFKLPNQELVVETENYVGQPEAPAFVKLEQDRTDEYLLLPDCDAVGVKQRQGRLEVKGPVAGPRPYSQGGVIGRVDQWVKWSFKPSQLQIADGITLADQLNTEFDKSGPWCAVEKKRYLQKYSFDSGSLVAVSPDSRPDTGCNIELTIIGAESSTGPWITFGFEAFGPSDRVMAMLDEAVKHFFAAHGPAPVNLDGRDSLSYATWVALLPR